MNRAKPSLRHLAKRLIIFESRRNESSTTKAAFSAAEKLRPQLTTLMGEGGFRALLARALALARAEVPWLRGLLVKADGTLDGLVELRAQLGPDEFLEGGVVFLAQLLGLLVAFIGENLTLRLAQEVWPKVPLNGLGLENTDKNENRSKNEKAK